MTDIKTTNESDVVENEITEDLTLEEQIQESNIEHFVGMDEQTREERLKRLNTVNVATALPVINWPDERLNRVSEIVSEEELHSAEFGQLIADMFATLKVENGIGLSAIQVNRPKRVAVFDFEGSRMVMINPVLIGQDSKMIEMQEGCISVPGVFHKNKRPAVCDVDFQTLDGVQRQIRFSGVFAFAVQHELDHMDGKVFVDDFNIVRRQMWKKKVKKVVEARNKS